MKPHDYIEALAGVLDKTISRDWISQIISAVPEQKLDTLSVQKLSRIIPGLVALSRSQGPDTGSPGFYLFEDMQNDPRIEITVIARDYPGLFSTLSGLLSASGFEITLGHVVTTRAVSGQRLIIDTFSGTLAADQDPALWVDELKGTLGRILPYYQNPELPAVQQSKYSPATQGAQGPESSGPHTSGRALVKRLVIEEVAAALSRTEIQPGKILAPMTITEETAPGVTRFSISSTDTPFFLFSISSALALHEVSIEAIDIQTEDERVLDILDLVDSHGNPITNPLILNRIKLSILLSKQFTYFIDRAPNPLMALERFDSLIQDIGEVRDEEDIRRFLASPQFQQELAALLGTSDFLWEDFIRVQHENILPMIKNIDEDHLLSTPPEDVEAALASHLQAAEKASLNGRGAVAAMDPLARLQQKIAAQTKALNEFKNRESFLVDLDHILVKNLDFFFLSRRLTALAEAVVKAALHIAWQEVVPRHGLPRTAAGVEAEWAVFGLGKLGGSALGYASDIELLFLFADNGSTDGPEKIANRDFFEKFFRSAAAKITARREGIFKVDLRLRPHGIDGPVAVKLQSFIDYFSKSGQAHSAERLALVRLRYIGGSKTLGDQVTRIRNQIIYQEDSIDIAELRSLRKRQIRTKDVADQINTKFSPGTLVDLEYNVQILQVIHGRQHEGLRVPGIHEALRQLSQLGTIEPEEAQAMTLAYQFFRKLINGLRMLRGNARDLFLPEENNMEYRYLARRIGYQRKEEQTESEQLRIDFETHSARVRSFVERHLGREAIPGETSGSVVDLVLSDSLSEDLIARVLQEGGIQNIQRGLVNLQSLAGSGSQRDTFAQVIVLAWDQIKTSTDPDMALNNWEQFVRRLEHPEVHYNQLLSQPKRLELLMRLFASSQFLSDTLIQNPGFFRWITDPRVVVKARDQIRMEEDLRMEADGAENRTDWLNRLRRFRKREILRIGLRDIGLGVKIEEIMGEISFLARACCEVSLEQVWKRLSLPQGPEPSRFVVCAYGKLGGWELNYSSDIDLVGIYEPQADRRTEEEEQGYTKVFRTLVQDLTDFTQEGQAYRVDLRLRPHGASGPIVSTLPSFIDYYRHQGDLWEHQALIKMKPIAGNLSIGEIALDKIRPDYMSRWSVQEIKASIATMREKGVTEHTKHRPGQIDIKNGIGGIRDIEFLVQGMQLTSCHRVPEILTGNTLKGLILLLQAGFLSQGDFNALRQEYTLFRRIEHYLQVAEDRQRHSLPESSFERIKLARCIAPQVDSQEFYKSLEHTMQGVRQRYAAFLSKDSSG